MKTLLFICAGFLLIAIAPLPIGYYTFLRIFVTFCAVLLVVKEQGRVTPWAIVFVILAILFNPIVPIYFHNKDVWKIIDIITGILFAVKGFLIK